MARTIPLELSRNGRYFHFDDPDSGLRHAFLPPLVLAVPADCRTLNQYLEWIPVELGRQLYLLIQAGDACMGLWEGDALLAHKALHKYVVRGHGKAQTTYLKSKGKSRYGSRLRLRNARTLLEDTCEKLTEWYKEWGPADRLFYSCPVRTWPEFLKTEPPMPDSPPVKIPLDVDRPTHEELLKIRRKSLRGSIQVYRIDPPGSAHATGETS
jgi:hypothetical protein